MIDEAVGRREQKKRQVRADIVQAALGLFDERGLEGTTMDDVAEAAGVSRRTVFRYFPTKEALTAPSHDERLATFRELLAEREGDDTTFDVLRRALLALARDYMDHRDEVVLVQRIVNASPAAYAYERALDREWERALEEALVAGPSRAARRRASVLAAALLGVVRATIRDWVEGNGEDDLVALGASNLAFLEGALDALH